MPEPRLKIARLVTALWLCGFATVLAGPAKDPPAPAEVPDVGTADAAGVDAAAVDADIASQELSGDA